MTLVWTPSGWGTDGAADTVTQKGVPADIDPDSITVFSDTPFVRTQ